MNAPLKLLACVVLCLGLAPLASTHRTEAGNVNGVLPAAYPTAPGFPTAVTFSGNFRGPVSWTLIALSNGTHNQPLAGVLIGVTNGAPTNSIATELFSEEHFTELERAPEGATALPGGETRQESVPEPSTLALFGTGLLAVVIGRRKSGHNLN
jgi:hypothetical protein